MGTDPRPDTRGQCKYGGDVKRELLQFIGAFAQIYCLIFDHRHPIRPSVGVNRSTLVSLSNVYKTIICMTNCCWQISNINGLRARVRQILLIFWVTKWWYTPWSVWILSFILCQGPGSYSKKYFMICFNSMSRQAFMFIETKYRKYRFVVARDPL